MYVKVTQLLLRFVDNLKEILATLFRAFNTDTLTIGDWYLERRKMGPIAVRLRNGRVVYLCHDANELVMVASNFNDFLAFINALEQYLKDWIEEVINNAKKTLVALSPYILSEELGE